MYAYRMQGRRTRTNIPTAPRLLEPQVVGHSIQEMLKRKQVTYKMYHDRRASKIRLPDLSVGDRVRLLNQKGNWQLADLRQVKPEQRTCVIQSDAL